MDPIRLALVDDHHVVRRGLRSYLSAFDDITIVGEAATGEEILERIEGWLPDVVLMDMLMPGGIDGVETTRRVRAIAPNTQVVVLTAYGDEPRVIAALRAGAIGYVKKDTELEILLLAIRAAARGRSVLDPSIAGIVLQDLQTAPDASDRLTERETEVLRLLARGLTNHEIAEVLVVGEETIKTHIGNILSKLQTAHRVQAVISALKRGIISLDEIDT